jgi:endonuclease YncB( thermonuclease family)
MKAKGLLTVVGSLDIGQFWPATKGNGSSDGDTVHLKVDPQTSFHFSSATVAKPKLTHAFIDAHVFDHGPKRVITSKSEIKIRLQGIDTPELHYPVLIKRDPAKRKFKGQFRQPFGAGAANALHAYLKRLITGNGTILHATFVSHIASPNDAVDSHGRFVGDILVGTASGKSINAWLIENGWAYPLFYDSMTADEVQTLVKAWKVGQKVAGRPGKAFEQALQSFDPKRTAESAKLPDRGKVNFPKIFRRQATFWTQVPGTLTGAEFVRRMGKPMKGKPETAYPLGYFLSHLSKLDSKQRVRLASRIGSKGQTLFKPPDLVFREDPATLRAANGKKITSW